MSTLSPGKEPLAGQPKEQSPLRLLAEHKTDSRVLHGISNSTTGTAWVHPAFVNLQEPVGNSKVIVNCSCSPQALWR